MAINTTALTATVVASLYTDGVPTIEAKRAADRFVGTLKRDHPEWFEKPKIKLDTFVLQRVGDRRGQCSAYSIESAWLREMENIVSNYQYLRNRAERFADDPDCDRGGREFGQRTAYKEILQRFAKLFKDHPDYERIEK